MAIELNAVKKKKSNVSKAVSDGSSLISNPIKKSDGTALKRSSSNKITLPKAERQKSAAKPLSDMIAMQFSGNAVARNNAIAGANVYDAVKSYSNRSKETAARYKRIAATKEIQDKAKGQSYLKKELPKSGFMLGGDPVARNRAIQTGIKANATEEEREAQAAKDLIAAANSPVERFMQGLGRGLALGPTTRFSWQEETPTEKMVSDLTNNTVSGSAGNMVGEALPYLMAYGKLGGAVGDAAMKLPGAAKLGGFGQGVVKSLAADTVLGAPLNANYVVNKQGLGGKEAVKEFVKQEALDLGLGVGTEFVGAAFKKLHGKNLKSEADLLKLTAAERAKVESYAEKLQRLSQTQYNAKVVNIRNPYKGQTPVISGDIRYNVPVLTTKNAIVNVNSANTRKELKSIYQTIFDRHIKQHNVTVKNLLFNGRKYDVTINKKAIGKVISANDLSLEKVAILDSLDDVISNGHYVGSGEVLGKNNEQIVRYDYFETEIKIGKGNYIVAFDVEVYPNTNNYKTHRVINEIDLTPLPPQT